MHVCRRDIFLFTLISVIKCMMTIIIFIFWYVVNEWKNWHMIIVH